MSNTRHRDFDAAIDEENLEASDFVLSGRTWNVAPEVPMGALLEVGKIVDLEADLAAVPILIELVGAMVVADQVEDFRKALLEIGPRKFWAVSAWIVEGISGRPFAELLSSPPPGLPDTDTSRPDSSSPDTPPAPSSDSPPASD